MIEFDTGAGEVQIIEAPTPVAAVTACCQRGRFDIVTQRCIVTVYVYVMLGAKALANGLTGINR